MLHLVLALMFVSNNDRIQQLETQMALQDAFRQQQRDYNAEIDTHVTRHMDDLVRNQGEQDNKIATLDSRVNFIYGLGDIGVWATGILVTISIVYNNRRYSENRAQHKENQGILRSLNDRIGIIEKQLHKHLLVTKED